MRQRASGLWARLGDLLSGPADHYSELLAYSSAWCLLEPSRIVFHSFCRLNHLLSSVCLFGVYDSGPSYFFG
jgi:hypothetical protein